MNGEDVIVVQEYGKVWLKSPLFHVSLFTDLDEIKEQKREAVFYIGIKKPPKWLIEGKIPYVLYHPKGLV